MERPLLFISHKHADSSIAKTLAEFIRAKSMGRVDIHLSSDPAYKGPKISKNLNDELRKALWQANAMILIYTSADQDWSFCMWECGVATDPKSPETNILVFQCGKDVPSPFAEQVRVNARKLDDLRRFTDALLRDPTFFRGHTEAIAPTFEKAESDKIADELQKRLEVVLPPLEEEAIEEWSAWPYVRIELPKSDVERLKHGPATDRQQQFLQVIKERGVVVESDSHAPQLFGQASFPAKPRFHELMTIWQEKFPTLDTTWFDSCCEQMQMGASRSLPIIRWATLKQVGAEAEFTPILSRVRQIPTENKIQFDIYFYNLSDPRVMPVTSRMIPKDAFFSKNMGQLEPGALKLLDLLRELNELGRNRIPFVSAQGHPLYIVHRSMIDRFLIEQQIKQHTTATGGKGIMDYTFADLLAEPSMKLIFEGTFAVVSKRASLAEAKIAMNAIPDCRDVFITADGKKEESMLGWLTNIDMDEHR